MRALAAALICALSVLIASGRAEAQSWIDQPFEPSSMSREDIATVQVALAYTGDFFGYADGVWRDDAQKAFEQYVQRVVGNVRPTFRHLKDLVVFLEDERVKNGWQIFYSETTDTSYLHPFELLKEVENKDAVEFLSDDGGFSLMVRFTDQAEMEEIHNWFRGEALDGSNPYKFNDSATWITDAKLEDDMNVYARSDFYNNSWSTLSMVVTPDHYYRMNVVAVSLTRGGSPATLMWTKGGVIDQLINGDAAGAVPAACGSDRQAGQISPRAVRWT